jgi:ribosome maturation protein Sdo1
MRIKTLSMAVHIAVQSKQMEQQQLRTTGELVDSSLSHTVDIQSHRVLKPTAKERFFDLLDQIKKFIRKH